jgi:GDPmannose 4,6-dehydratase
LNSEVLGLYSDRSFATAQKTVNGMTKVALITGINGQDGSYLAEELLSLGYLVHGTIRRRHTSNLSLISHLLDQVHLHEVDLLNQEQIAGAIDEIGPHEIYNLAAQSSVGQSWDSPVKTGDVTALGAARILESIRRIDKSIRFYQASSSEMFGKVVESPQTETTAFWPRSPYGVAKVYGHFITVNYRESFDMFACSGILFNHESPRRGENFVTRKITRAVAQIKLGLANELRLGNLAAKRDFGFAGDYVSAMRKMLQTDEPRDYVIGTGVTRSVQDFVELAFARVNLDWQDFVIIDPKFYRPAEVDVVRADASRAGHELDWQPKVSFENLVNMMVDADMERFQAQNPATETFVRGVSFTGMPNAIRRSA